MNGWYRFFSNRLVVKVFLVFLLVFLATASIAVYFLIRFDTAHERDKLAARVGNQAARAASALRGHGIDIERLKDVQSRRLARDLLAPLNAESAVECVGLQAGAVRGGDGWSAELPGSLSCLRYARNEELHRVVLPIMRGELYLIVYFNEDPIADEAQIRSQLVVSVMVTALILSIFSAYMGYKLTVSKRLQSLRRTIVRASEGGARHVVPPGPLDEIGMLLTGYNDLVRAETLRENELQKAFRAQARAQAALKEANEELETWIQTSQSEQRFRDFASSSSDYFWELDSNLNFSFFSERFTELTGLDQEEYLAASAVEKGLPGAEAESEERYRRAITDREAFRDVDFKVTLPDNKVTWISLTGTPAYDGSNNFVGYRGTGSDISERMSMLERLHRSERMDALGQLTGGIAHDFNNLLGIIHGHAELIELSKYEPTGSGIESSVREILGASDRGAALVRHLLAFGGKAESSPASLDVVAALRAIQPLLETASGDAIDLRMQLEEPLAPVYCDPAQFDSAILNLVINSRDAMPGGGVVTVRAANHDVRGRSESDELPTGRYVVVEVVDTGSGIPSSDLQRVFEPFFTTKRQEGGSGLGLSVVHGFAEQSGGKAIAKSTLGEGTTVSVFFPHSDVVSEPSDESLPDSAVPDFGDCRILVVEDNEPLRAVTVAYLNKAGFSVVEAETAHSALEVLRFEANIALVLTDIALPGGMSGAELADRIAVDFPGVPVIPTSGHAREITGAALPILEKPYTFAVLTSRIEEALNRT